jgi:hypothetical protein
LDSKGELHDVEKTKSSESLVSNTPCPIKAIPSNCSNKPVDLSDDLGVTAIVAIMEPVTEKLSPKIPQNPLRSHPSNKIRVLLDTGSNGDLFFYEKGKCRHSPYLTR